jgi:hypothetical protein
MVASGYHTNDHRAIVLFDPAACPWCPIFASESDQASQRNIW